MTAGPVKIGELKSVTHFPVMSTIGSSVIATKQIFSFVEMTKDHRQCILTGKVMGDNTRRRRLLL